MGKIIKALVDWNPSPGDAFAYWCRGPEGGRTGDVRVFKGWVTDVEYGTSGRSVDGGFMDMYGYWECISRQEELKIEDFV